MKAAFQTILFAGHIMGLFSGLYFCFQLTDPVLEKLICSLLIILLLNLIRLVQQAR
jgi:hypothetical protein